MIEIYFFFEKEVKEQKEEQEAVAKNTQYGSSCVDVVRKREIKKNSPWVCLSLIYRKC
jgi:hypothetical protein